MPQGPCRLCGTESELQLSHILPAFTFRWLRETSGNGHIRLGLSPNQRVQDGLKLYWLCASCEGLFSRSETAFAGQLFHPYLAASGGRFPYSRWLLHFCASVSWRVLRYCIDEQHLQGWEPEALARVVDAEATWRAFLLGQIPHPGVFRQHILPLDRLSGATGALAQNINRYIMRAIDMDIVRGSKDIFVYSKLGRFIILGFIHVDNKKYWRGAKVHATVGTIEPMEYTVPQAFGEYLNGKARRMAAVLDSVSERQKSKIEESFRENVDKYIGSDAFAAMSADVRMFGDKAFSKPTDSKEEDS